MKKHIVMLTLVAAVIAVTATPVIPFTNWNDIIEQSPDIIIAKRTEQPLITLPTNGMGAISVSDAGLPNPIEVVAVLKGDTKPGPAQLWLPYSFRLGELPHRGDMFLVFARGHSNTPTNLSYQAIENYRIVFVAPDFYFGAWTNLLAGKPLKAQVRKILEYRLSSLDEEMQRLQNEKKRVEDGVKELKN
jgi:hypothetical protein